MALYKDAQGNIHDDMDGDALPFLPVGSIKLTAVEEADFLNPPPSLEKVIVDKLATLEESYLAAIQLPVAYMDTTFQADGESQNTLTKCLVAGSIPNGFFWLDELNTPVPMTFAQLQGLAGVMLAQGQAAFITLQARKTSARSAATVAEVQAVVW